MQTVFDETNPEQLTLVDILRWRAQHQPQQEAYTFLLDGETKKVQMTYAELDLQARRIAALLQDHAALGERALLLYPSGLEYVAAVFGCFYAGVVAVPAYPPRLDQSLTRIQAILQDTQATTVLTTSTILSSLHHTLASDPWDNVQDLRWIETDTIDTVGAQDTDKPLPLHPEMLALLQYTSGSTGSPKGVMFTHDHLMQSAALTQATATLTPQDRAVFWTPPYHNLGLVGSILQALYTGFPTTLMAPETFLQQPLRWLQVLSSWQATVSGAPNFAYDLCVKKATQDDIKTLNLSHWAIAFVSGEPVRAETLERFAATFAPCGFRPEALYPCYGMTEATLLISASRRLIKPRVRTFEREALETGRVVETTGQRVADRPLVNCGSVQPGQEIVIVDPQTLTPCPPDTIGEIWFRGPNIAGGYWGKAEETREMFHAFLANSGDGPFFRTGDLGFCVENELYLTGRLKDLIIIRGRNLYPQDIEQVVEKSHPLFRPGGCAAFTVEGPTSEQLVVVQEVIHHADDAVMQEAIQSIFRAAPSEFDVEVTAIALVDTGTIPRTVMGKIQRHTCRSLFLADKLNTVTSWRRPQEYNGDIGEGEQASTPKVQEAIDWLVMQLARRAQIDPRVFDRHTPFVQFGLNSLEAIGFSGALEQRLGCSFPPKLLYEYPSIDALARHLEDVLRDQPQERNETTPLPVIVPDPTQQYMPFPSTDVQQAYWIGRSSLFELGNVGNHGYAEVDAVGLDLARLQLILRRLIQRHPMLRAVMLPDGQQQILEHVPPVQVEWIDLSGLEQPVRIKQLAHIRDVMDHQVFQVEQWPAGAIRVSQLHEQRVRIHISMEVLFVDARSLNILLQEFLHLYHEPEASLPPLSLSFRDYIIAATRLQQSALYQHARNYWQERLQQLPAAPALPLVMDPVTLSRPRFVPRSARMEATQWERLKTRAARAGLTPSGILLAAFAEVLTLWSKTPHFCINLTVFQHLPLHEQVHEILGDFTSLLPLAVDNTLQDSFEQRAKRIQEQMWRDLNHYYYSGVRILRDLAHRQGSRGGAYPHLPQVSMPTVFTSLLAHKMDRAYPGPWQELAYYVTQTPQVWLDHQVLEVSGNLVLYWQAVEALFPPGLLDTMFGAYTQLLERLATDDEVWRREDQSAALLPPAQLALFTRINATDSPIADTLLHGLFLAQAKLQLDQLAVISARRTLTYQEVSSGATLLAHQLRQWGARPNQLVAIVMEKGWEQVVAVLGVLISGAAYLPIDPKLPQERVAFLLDDGEVTIVLTQSWIDEQIAWTPDMKRMCVDSLDLSKEVIPTLTSIQRPDDLAYVIYTSGSTGVPKGVMIDHRGAVNTILDINRRFAVNSNDRVLALSALNFDLSVYDLFGPLAVGGTIVMPTEETLRDPAAWLKILMQGRVTLWNTVPALLQMLVEYTEAHPEILGHTSLRLALLSGDWIPVTLPERLRKHLPEVAIISLGGATEASIWSICYPIPQATGVDPAWKSIPYGLPLSNQRFFVLNETLDFCPVWVPGHLYIAGTGLARGYWRDTAKTEASFFHHPRTDERLYRTGDLGRYLPDGNIEFLGREDSQVKVQGHRIELGEIEQTLLRHPAVQSAIAIATTDPHGDKRLLAYVVLASPTLPTSPTSLPHIAAGFGQTSIRKEIVNFNPQQVLGVAAATDTPHRQSITDEKPWQDLVFPYNVCWLCTKRVTIKLASPADPTHPAGHPETVRVYKERLSYRTFLPEAIPFRQFSDFLRTLSQIELAGLPKYRYPSAGSIYPVQIYVEIKAQCIEGIPEGIYYFNPQSSELILLSDRAHQQRDMHAPINQPIFDESAFSLFLIGDLTTISSLYGGAARDFCLLEAGYMSQLLMMTAPQYQIGLCPIGDLDFEQIRDLFMLTDRHLLLHTLLGGRVDPSYTTGWSFLPESTTRSTIAQPVAASEPPLVVTPTALRTFLQEKLPAYMLPSAIMILDRLPLTPNGKVDYKNLPLPETQSVRKETGYRVPTSPLEKTIAAVWQEVLGLAQVGVHDNFFDLGGNSLLMVRAYTKLRKLSDRDLSIIEMFFQYPTIHALAEVLSQSIGQQSPSSRTGASPVPTRSTDSRTGASSVSTRFAAVSETDIAIIGMSSRLPGSKNTGELWQNLRDGKECITAISDGQLRAALAKAPGYIAEADLTSWLNDPNYVRMAAGLEDIDLFAATFFGYNPTEAAMMDPQQRFFIECAWEALEDAAYDPDTYKGLIGVYAGADVNLYDRDLHAGTVFSADSILRFMSNANDYLTTRVSYKLNLKGPSLAVQSACSTSLVAVHLACQSLKNRESDMALAGGVVVHPIQEIGYFYQKDGFLSPDGHCRPFDAQAQGTIFANGGVGVVVLKRLTDALADGDNIYAVIKGSAINNDGSFKTGYTAPGIDGQMKVLLDALAVAAVDPASLSYIETHGTGTPLGDPIEIAALTQAFNTGTQKKSFCAIGSLKSNMGHLGPVAGVAGLIKTSLALKYKMLPPSLHYTQPNPQIDFANSPFYVNTQLTTWDTDALPRRAGVSSFGIGGTNAHVILEEAPTYSPTGDPLRRIGLAPIRPAQATEIAPLERQSWQLLILSAKTSTALEQMRVNLLDHLKEHPDLNLADLAFTLQVGRKAFPHRLMLVCQTVAEAVSQLEAKECFLSVSPPIEQGVVFMFPGQGPQYVNMGKELYAEEPIFRQQVDTCAALLVPYLHKDLRAVIYPPFGQEATAQDQLEHMLLAQPAIFVIEYALAQLWLHKGIRPAAMIGHSIGEYVAACLAGVLSLQDALFLVTLRGRLMDQLENGAMLAVSLPEEEILPLLGTRLSLAAHNSMSDCVVSGPAADISDLQHTLTEQEIPCQILHVSRASHSQMLEPVLAQFTHEVSKLRLHPPTLPYISNLTGQWITEQEATDPEYWTRHWRQTVRFAEGIQLLLDVPATILLEVGPGRSLSTLAQRMVDGHKVQANTQSLPRLILSSLRHPQAPVSDVTFLLNTCGRLWCSGVTIDWSQRAGTVGTGLAPVRTPTEQRRRLSLPTYPFERERYWIFPGGPRTGAAGTGLVPVRREETSPLQMGKKANIADWFSVPFWKRSPQRAAQVPAEQLEHKGCWIIFADTLELGTRLGDNLREHAETVIIVKAGTQFGKVSDWEYTLSPEHREDYDALLKDMNSRGLFPTNIVHLWTLIATDHVPSGLSYFETAQALGFYSLLFLIQALDEQNVGTMSCIGPQPLQITVVSNNLQEVIGGEVFCPVRATVLGINKVASHEYPHMAFRYIDVVLPEAEPEQEKMIEQLLADLLAQPSDSMVAYRGSYRWVPCLEPVRLDAEDEKLSTEHNPERLRQQGVYLITGGLGGIGLSIASDLARRVKARLVLTGRTALPAREEWPHRLATASEDDAIAGKIHQVMMLEELGAQVLVVKADVTDLEQMQAVIAQVHERFGALHGVIHAAGLPGEGLIQLKTPEVAAEVLAPKVKGTLVLEAVLQDEHLDFIVLCSSLYSVVGGIGQVDYCAANSFLDSFASYHTAKSGKGTNSYPTISINWDGWQEVGMAVDALAAYEKFSLSTSNGHDQLNSKIGKHLQYVILPQEGVEAFRRILSHTVLPQIIVSPRDIQVLRTELLPLRLDLEDGGFALSTPQQRPHLQTAYVAPRDEIEQQIAAIWQKVLGIEQIGIQDHFFEAGGDSLMGLRTINELRKTFRVDLSLRLLLKETPTVESMAKVIRQKQMELIDDEQLAEILQNISQMSEEEALQLLEKNSLEPEREQ